MSQPPPRGGGAGLAAALAAMGILAVVVFWLGQKKPAVLVAAPSPTPAFVAPPAEIRTVAGNPIRSAAEVIAATPPDILRFADALNSPRQSPRADCLLLIGLLDLYRSVEHVTDPVGDNEEITAVLTGNNPMGYAFIRPDSPAINAKQQLCDRWGTPYFFHQISGTQMQIRSGGPDRRMWTQDDIMAGP